MRSVRTRLTAFTIAIVAMILLFMAGFVRYRVHANLVGEIDRQLAADMAGIKSGKLAYLHSGMLRNPSTRGVKPPYKESNARVRLLELVQTNNSSVVLESKLPVPKLVAVVNGKVDKGPNQVADLHGAEAAVYGIPVSEDFTLRGEPMRSLSTPVRDEGKIIAIAQAVRSLRPVQAQTADLDRALLTSIPAATLLAALGGSFLIAGVMRPLRNLTESARRLEADLSGERLKVEGCDEFAELANAFKQAFERTSASFESQARAMAQLERFTGDAGHELRTPLGSIKGSASYLLHMGSLPAESVATVEIIDRSADKMAKLIDDLLLLARQDSGASPQRLSTFSVADLVAEVVETLGPKGAVQVSIDVKAGLTVTGDRGATERVVTNLLSNAIRYARTRVEVSAWLDGEALMIRIADDGEGIAAEHLGSLGERFYRPDEARSREHGGSGLGLAIAKSLCESRGGWLQITSSLGVGTTATAWLTVD